MFGVKYENMRRFDNAINSTLHFLANELLFHGKMHLSQIKKISAIRILHNLQIIEFVCYNKFQQLV